VSPLAFARALIGRWDRRVIWPRPLGMVFRTPAPAGRPARTRPEPASQFLQTLRQSVRVDLRPAIALTLVRPLELSHQTASTREVESIESAAERTRVEQLVLRNSSALASERVLERALSRSRRVELLVRSAPGSAVARAAGGPDLPPRLVVQRAAAPPAAESTQPARHDQLSRPAPRDLASPELDLGRLTDQVVGAIDGRLAAHAERLGRG
jgi:hypothetical protein